LLPFERVTLIASLNFLIRGVWDGLAEGKVANPFIPDPGQCPEAIDEVNILGSHRVGVLIVASNFMEIFASARNPPTSAINALVMQNHAEALSGAITESVNNINDEIWTDDIVAVYIHQYIFDGDFGRAILTHRSVPIRKILV
jgi:hypothetical protein